MSYTELQEKRGRLVTQAREALDEIKSNTDESRAGELTERHDKIMGEFDKIETEYHDADHDEDLDEDGEDA